MVKDKLLEEAEEVVSTTNKSKQAMLYIALYNCD
jgi:hypothetical protein